MCYKLAWRPIEKQSRLTDGGVSQLRRGAAADCELPSPTLDKKETGAGRMGAGDGVRGELGMLRVSFSLPVSEGSR